MNAGLRGGMLYSPHGPGFRAQQPPHRAELISASAPGGTGLRNYVPQIFPETPARLLRVFEMYNAGAYRWFSPVNGLIYVTLCGGGGGGGDDGVPTVGGGGGGGETIFRRPFQVRVGAANFITVGRGGLSQSSTGEAGGTTTFQNPLGQSVSAPGGNGGAAHSAGTGGTSGPFISAEQYGHITGHGLGTRIAGAGGGLQETFPAAGTIHSLGGGAGDSASRFGWGGGSFLGLGMSAHGLVTSATVGNPLYAGGGAHGLVGASNSYGGHGAVIIEIPV